MIQPVHWISHTDAKLRPVLKQQFADTTTILIAQTNRFDQHADKILVLENGRMSGFGRSCPLTGDEYHLSWKSIMDSTGGKSKCLQDMSRRKTKRDEKTVKRLWHYCMKRNGFFLNSITISSF